MASSTPGAAPRRSSSFAQRVHRILFTRLPGALSSPLAFGLILVLVGGLIALRVSDPISLKNLRMAQFDQFQRSFPRIYQPAAVRIVDVDEYSLQQLGQWPWPRTRVAELVQKLNEAGAASIAFDMILAEPDRTSPQAVARSWNRPVLSTLLKGLPDHDEELARTLDGRNVILGTSLSITGDDATPPPRDYPVPYRVIKIGTGDPSTWLHGFDTVVEPLPVLARHASGLGALNFATDVDGVVRRVPLMLMHDREMVPTLSAEALRVAQGARNHLLRVGEAGTQDVRVGSVTIPTNAHGEVWLHYTPPVDSRTVSAAKVVAGEIPRESIEGHIMLIGSSAAGLMDLRYNPMGELMPGVQAHALALEQVLSGHYLQRPNWADAGEIVALGIGALVVGLVALAAPALWASAFGVLMIGGSLGGAVWAFQDQRLLLDGLTPALAMMLSFGIASGLHHLVSERQQRWVREAFSRYVSPNRVAYLVEHPEQLQLGGTRQDCSFVFTDLAGFTTLMEQGDPARAVSLLNAYLDSMLAIVFKYEGTLDRIVGDAVAVLFSAPVVQPDHHRRALQCALEMDRFASDYSRRLQADGVGWGHTRVGVHCGEVIVGNFGGTNLFDYRALGDPINTAARLETVNKHLGTRMCVSGDIMQDNPDVPSRFVARLVLKGKSRALPVYEPEAAKDVAARVPKTEWDHAVAMLGPDESRREPDRVLAVFEDLSARFPEDPLVMLHLERLRAGARDDLIVMSEK